MMKSEFIERTGFEPTEAEYREIEELLKRATEAERKLAILKEAFDIITGKETK